MKSSPTLIVFITTLIVFTSCKEVKEVEQTNELQVKRQVQNYDGPDAALNIMGFFVEPVFAGRIDTTGIIELNLPANFIDATTTAFDTYNSSSQSAYELSPIGIEDIFSPLEDLTITGSDSRLALAGKFYGFEIFNEDIKVGHVFPASSIEFMKHLMSPDKYPLKIGYHYMYIYSSKKVSIKGSNEYPIEINENGETILSTKTNYDVNLLKGWNVVKYEIKNVVTDKKNQLHIQNASFKTLKSTENSKNWIFSKI